MMLPFVLVDGVPVLASLQNGELVGISVPDGDIAPFEPEEVTGFVSIDPAAVYFGGVMQVTQEEKERIAAEDDATRFYEYYSYRDVEYRIVGTIAQKFGYGVSLPSGHWAGSGLTFRSRQEAVDAVKALIDQDLEPRLAAPKKRAGRFQPRGQLFAPLPAGMVSGYPIARPTLQAFRQTVPSEDVVRLSALFAVSTIRVRIEAAEESFECFAERYESARGRASFPSIEQIRACFGTLKNTKARQFSEVSAYAPVIHSALRQGMRDRQLRHHLAVQTDLPVGLGLAKLSFTLLLLGQDIMCLDTRILSRMFGSVQKAEDVEKGWEKRGKRVSELGLARYEAVEESFLSGNRFYDPRDPIGRARAQWMSWEPLGHPPVPATHSVWLKVVTQIEPERQRLRVVGENPIQPAPDISCEQSHDHAKQVLWPTIDVGDQVQYNVGFWPGRDDRWVDAVVTAFDCEYEIDQIFVEFPYGHDTAVWADEWRERVRPRATRATREAGVIPLDRPSVERAAKQLLDKTAAWLREMAPTGPMPAWMRGEPYMEGSAPHPSAHLRDVRGEMWAVQFVPMLWSEPRDDRLFLSANTSPLQTIVGNFATVRVNINTASPEIEEFRDHPEHFIEKTTNILLHELTHVRDVIRSRDIVHPHHHDDFAAYVNSPPELHAFTQQIVDEVVRAVESEEVDKSTPDVLVRSAFWQSETWTRIQKHLTDKNRNHVISVVYRTLDSRGLLPTGTRPPPAAVASEAARTGTYDHLVVLWQGQPIGDLRREPSGYTFTYRAPLPSSVRPLVEFPDVVKNYRAPFLFSTFAQRIPDPRRPDYARMMTGWGVQDPSDPMEVLARSGGRLATDALTLEMVSTTRGVQEAARGLRDQSSFPRTVTR